MHFVCSFMTLGRSDPPGFWQRLGSSLAIKLPHTGPKELDLSVVAQVPFGHA